MALLWELVRWAHQCSFGALLPPQPLVLKMQVQQVLEVRLASPQQAALQASASQPSSVAAEALARSVQQNS
jgi:hypothetical protein